MKKLTKRPVLIILGVLLLSSFFIIFKAIERDSSKPEKYDLAYLEAEAPRLIQEYMDERSDDASLLSCYVFTQNDHVFAFFDLEPHEGHYLLGDMPSDIIEQCLFYGYAKFEKRFHKYYIADFQTGMNDTKITLTGVTGERISLDNHRYCYGKILDDNIEKIEFYDHDVLVGTYYVGDKDYYFIELNNNNVLGTISYRTYDKEDKLLYGF